VCIACVRSSPCAHAATENSAQLQGVVSGLAKVIELMLPIQALLINADKLSPEELLLSCKQQGPCDSMVAFLRAITAAGFMAKSQEWLPFLQGSLNSESSCMRYLCEVYILPLASRFRDELWKYRWPDQPHLMVLAEALGLHFTVYSLRTVLLTDVFGAGRRDCDYTFDLVFTGCHYELIYRA